MIQVPDTLRGLGIDPGTSHSGWAIHLVRRGAVTLEHTGDVRGDDPIAIAQVVQTARDRGVLFAWIEDQFFDVKKGNPDTLKKLARVSGRWEQACVDRDIAVEWVHPTTWHTAMLGRARMTRTILKTMAIARVRSEYKLEAKPDVADAILIGRYGADMVALEQRGRGRRRP